MSDVKPLSGSDLQIKPFLTATRKVGGRIVREELEAPVLSDEDGLDTLLDGIDSREVEEGRDRLLAENPHMASMQLQEMMGFDGGSAEVAMQFMDPVRIASSKRIGTLADKETGETISFRRMGSSVELSGPDGQVLHKLAAHEFDEVIRTGQFDVM